MKAEIIAIGTEILLGDIVNTNAQFLAKELAALGIDVYHQSVIGDNEERIIESFEKAFERCDLVITTGGLGPTQDDLTKELGAKYFNKKLVLHEPSLDWIKTYLDMKDEAIVEANKKQAYFPEGSIILPNPNGTAPGSIVSENNKILIILPGPPREMKPMFNDHVKKYLEGITGEIIKSKILRLFGIGESLMAQKLNNLIQNSKNPTVAPYAKDNDVTLRITAKGNSEKECDDLINPVDKEIKDALGEYIYGEGETSLENVVSEILCNNKLSVSTAESCTGGMIAASLISYPGISDVFKEGAVTYSNESKMKRLGVSKETLDRYGAVSEETAREMAIGIAREANTDISISTTGIAGPGGGTDEKPVGLVYIGVFIKGKVVVNKFNFTGNRERIRRKTTMNALNILRKELLKI
ncbi:competence/damage-inducible protein A [Clostridium tertium]|jgi:nicotinamide-nucleotide amidase|uniref:Putative competence-damage inducible protein n=1 Tax=Clostridium tertium TaxID=1559 RepID=A0A9X3XNF0_9CLOT|nr:competence/damage-inducible protein A [Clostridium tertium]MBU6137367.1 competence/damage-inducible protein A [Clostridium tertium]MDB1935334.1 competence/damage-inducible protein A [Clostridium tertium]MDB1939067.1 competence/damage-inducible protein A [Clostridium tertium]MDB1942379.1 competence/damage-inducible protein A [Clostridium tertium]MDB1971439.1 competence/damage-inducible protein A [Clostridium tertium]